MRISPLALALSVATIATHAPAVVVPGGGPAKSDCYVGFEVGGTPAPTASGGVKVDGKACGSGKGTCTFSVQACINEPVSGCTAAPVTAIKGGKGLPLPATGGSDHLCGAAAPIPVPFKKTKMISMVGITSAKPKKDKDKLVLRCKTRGTDPECIGGSPCAPNTAGGFREVVLRVAGQGTDLDNGWTGISHNFPVTPNATIHLCLSGAQCDNSPTATCDAAAPTGGGTPNGPAFGAPLPLLAASTPVCVVSLFKGNIAGGTVKPGTGEITGPIGLTSQIFLTSSSEVCPRCKGGTCTSGARQGQSCMVDGTITVAQSVGDKSYPLSRDCVPQPPFAAALPINFNPLTTGTASGTTAQICGSPGPPLGSCAVSPKDDDCGSGTCSAPCSGNACVSRADDPTNPGTQICIDSKGGLSQVCCSSDASKPCFPTRNGGLIVRKGRAAAPTVDPTNANRATSNEVLVSNFCIPATQACTVDPVTGLPGPGAIVLPVAAEWLK